MEQGLTSAMFDCLSDETMTAPARIFGDQSRIMRKFEEIIVANTDQPLYLIDVCKQIGVSDRTLRTCCHEHLGMNPHRYLWLRRMHLARRMLRRAEQGSATVTEIAMGCGFGELGRFAVQYHGLFGEPPSATLRRSAWQAGRGLQVIRVSGAAADHPFRIHVPEGRYLKGVLCRVL